jgi:hypothetical protein
MTLTCTPTAGSIRSQWQHQTGTLPEQAEPADHNRRLARTTLLCTAGTLFHYVGHVDEPLRLSVDFSGIKLAIRVSQLFSSLEGNCHAVRAFGGRFWKRIRMAESRQESAVSQNLHGITECVWYLWWVPKYMLRRQTVEGCSQYRQQVRHSAAQSGGWGGDFMNDRCASEGALRY